MSRRSIKTTVHAYGKVWKFDLDKYCGYIKCDRVKIVIPISHIAVPLETDKGISFMCNCGNHTDSDYYYHTLFYKGKEIKYEHDN